MFSIRLAAFAILFAAMPLMSGCASAVAVGTNTALDSLDLQQMTDQMAASLVADPDVQSAIGKEGTLKVVVQPVENRMTGEILPRGEAEAFIARIRFLLAKQAPDKFTWVINRETFYRLRATELEAQLGPSPDAVNPRYCLWAQFYSLTKEDSNRRTSSYLCVYELTDLDRRTTLWTDKYEVKKVAVKGFLDR
ncbi:hypothetical protein [Humisphaera borealis]|uniref:Penicillin-binding protein activator LpoB n=1 Tax=Humisphaera borealis TaxID=2807512 RepID=A0A7M2WYW4_9BACT|nr:hypothetical protein [Humisphaera borealis]QOV90666.1 hypothetical protein IPV69_04710 [Humisphaera borealis]